MIRLLALLIVLLWWTPAEAQNVTGEGGGGSGVTTIASGTELPATCTPGDLEANGLFLDTDDGVLYFCEATDTLTPLNLAAEADTLNTVFNRGKTITGANSEANAFQVGDGTTPICLFTDATLGPVIKPCTDSNTRTYIWDGFTWGIRDIEGDADMLIVDPDAATPKEMYAFQSGYYPLKSVWVGARNLEGDGTQCPARPTAVTINSGPKIPTFICTDNNAARLDGYLRMPNDWDGGTITFTHSYIQTAADTSALNGDIAAQCRGTGEAPSSTWGSEVAIDDAAVTGSNANDLTTSAAVTPAGTCAAGDMLYFKYELDATGTTTAVATLHHLGFHITYSSTSLSH